MKVVVHDEKKVSDIAYPCLMKLKHSEDIVLFFGATSGVVLQGDLHCNGYTSHYWEVTAFTTFTGTVELSNA